MYLLTTFYASLSAPEVFMRSYRARVSSSRSFFFSPMDLSYFGTVSIGAYSLAVFCVLGMLNVFLAKLLDILKSILLINFDN